VAHAPDEQDKSGSGSHSEGGDHFGGMPAAPETSRSGVGGSTPAEEGATGGHGQSGHSDLDPEGSGANMTDEHGYSVHSDFDPSGSDAGGLTPLDANMTDEHGYSVHTDFDPGASPTSDPSQVATQDYDPG